MKRTVILILGLALILAVFVSPYASKSPDGLERVAGLKGFLHLAEKTKPLVASPVPDYSMPGMRSKKAAKGIAGGIGTILVFCLGYGVSLALKGKRGNGTVKR